MHYVLDTGFFVLARGYYPDTFPSFWEKLTEAANENIVSSVSEVSKEIKAYGGSQDHLLAWIARHTTIFKYPNEEEQQKLRKIMQLAHKALPEKKLLSNKAWADPLVIAKAWSLEATVVTRETSAKNNKGEVDKPIKIPDICEALQIRCLSPQAFMKEQKWSF